MIEGSGWLEDAESAVQGFKKLLETENGKTADQVLINVVEESRVN